MYRPTLKHPYENDHNVKILHPKACPCTHTHTHTIKQYVQVLAQCYCQADKHYKKHWIQPFRSNTPTQKQIKSTVNENCYSIYPNVRQPQPQPSTFRKISK